MSMSLADTFCMCNRSGQTHKVVQNQSEDMTRALHDRGAAHEFEGSSAQEEVISQSKWGLLSAPVCKFEWHLQCQVNPCISRLTAQLSPSLHLKFSASILQPPHAFLLSAYSKYAWLGCIWLIAQFSSDTLDVHVTHMLENVSYIVLLAIYMGGLCQGLSLAQ